MRIGTGWDVHRLVKKRKLIIGGVDIPFSKGLAGHSDADVLIHAIIDSILGAMGEGDIGTHFSDNDKKYKGISGKDLLSAVLKIIRKKGYGIGNIDSTVIAEKPRLSGYIKQMKKNISSALKISQDKISVKAKTEEKLGYIGKGYAIAAQAVCLLNKKD